MHIDELFQMLAYGELSNHHMAAAGDGTLAVAKRPQITHFCNEGLMRLYTKFVLREKALILELVDGVTLYHLAPEYSTTGFNPLLATHAYIKDIVDDPFTGDVIKVMSAQNSWGDPRPLNDQHNKWSVNTPSPQTLQIAAVRLGEVISVSYQAAHRKLEYTTSGFKEVSVPPTLLGALLAFIAYKVYFNMNTPEAQAVAQGHLAMFNNVCADTTEADALNQSISGYNNRFTSRGWK